MTNEFSANLDQPLTPIPTELSASISGTLADIDDVVTLPEGASKADTGEILTEGVTDVSFGSLEAVSGTEPTYTCVEPLSDAAPDTSHTDQIDEARQVVENALKDKTEPVSERNEAIRTLALDLAGLSPEDRAQHPNYRGERQDGEHFSDMQLVYEDKTYIALTPLNGSFREDFENRIAGLSWEGVDTPPPGVEMGITYSDAEGEEVIICKPAAGKPTYHLSTDEIRAIPDSHIERVIEVSEYHADRGNMIDRIGHNFFYDPKEGFTVIDCEPTPPGIPYDAEMIFEDFIVGVAGFEDMLEYLPENDMLLAREDFRARAKAIQQRHWAKNVQ